MCEGTSSHVQTPEMEIPKRNKEKIDLVLENQALFLIKNLTEVYIFNWAYFLQEAYLKNKNPFSN